jgi:hypothetical protein
MSDCLIGPRLKLARAKEQIIHLDALSAKFFREHWRAIIVDKPQSGERAIHVKADQPIPPQFGVLIGEIVHNLRSALDIAVWHFVAPHSPKKEDRVQFPFTLEKERLPASIANRQIDVAGEEVAQVIREAEPYYGGRGDLWSLHKLSILDKHRILTPVGHIASFENFNPRNFDPSAPEIATYDRFGFVGGENQDVLRWPSDLRPLAHKRELDCTFELMFAKDQPFTSSRVISTMDKVMKRVGSVIGQFERIST